MIEKLAPQVPHMVGASLKGPGTPIGPGTMTEIRTETSRDQPEAEHLASRCASYGLRVEKITIVSRTTRWSLPRFLSIVIVRIAIFQGVRGAAVNTRL